MIKLEYQKLAEEFLGFMETVRDGPIPHPPHPMEFSRGEMGILIYLIHQNDGVSAGDLSAYLRLTTGRIAAALKTLEKKKYIERRTDSSDGRKVLVFITALGNEITQSKKKQVIDRLTKDLEKFTIEEAEQFVQLTKKFFTP